MTDAGDKGVPSRGLGRVENGNRACARRDHGAIGKPNPLALVLTEELVADSPVPGLVLAPVGVDLSSDFGGQCVSQAFHRSPRVYAGTVVILPPSGPSDECRAQVQSLVRHHSAHWFHVCHLAKGFKPRWMQPHIPGFNGAAAFRDELCPSATVTVQCDL